VLGTGRHQRVVERRRERRASKPDKGPPRWQREIGKGSARITFVVGALLTLPGASYLAALDGIVKLDPGTVQTVLLVLMVNIIMLTLLEVPLISFAVAPDWTPRTIQRVKDWFARNGLRAAVIGAVLIGGLLIARGLITLLG
jgi:Sap, sulfolipid-1-addressing protein